MPRFGGKRVTHTVSSTDEETVMDKIYSIHRGLAIHHYRGAGTLRVYYVWSDGSTSLLDTSVTSGAAFNVFDFDFPIPEEKITFEADSASGNVYCEAVSY